MPARAFAAALSLTLASVAWTAAPASAATSATNKQFCSRLGHSIEASAGAQMYCFGAQPSGPAGGGSAVGSSPLAASPFSANVNAANLSEDVSPSGARAYGQSETSVAATSSYVVEGWNDSTTFFSPCPSPMNKEEATGVGFSSDGGASFVDQGGLPNSACDKHILGGDPSVEAWQSGGKSYFYIASLYPSINPAVATNPVALTACKASGGGSSATLNCGQPINAAVSTSCGKFFDQFFCSFLDKEYLSIDPVRGRLYVTYTEFGLSPQTFSGQVELAVCDIGTPAGGTGPAGGTAARPVCERGTPASPPRPNTSPYMVMAPGDPNCESEGQYPAVDTATGDLYTAFEFNAETNIFNPPCFGTQTQEVLSRVPFSCLTLTTVSPCSGPSKAVTQPITSLDSAFIPGYNRFPANDFPRIVVDSSVGTVSIVWNDAGTNPLGDILLRSYKLGALDPVQSAPVRLNSGTTGLHFLPAVRNSSASGKISVSWFDRATANTATTNVRAAMSIDPRLTTTPASNTLVTTAATNWNNVSSDIVPNFGDYTDNYAAGGRLYLAWSDGRLGVPQPFEANAPMP